MKAVNCGAANEWVALYKATEDMGFKVIYPTGTTKETWDFHMAALENYDKTHKFEQSDMYKAWIASGNEEELKF